MSTVSGPIPFTVGDAVNFRGRDGKVVLVSPSGLRVNVEFDKYPDGLREDWPSFCIGREGNYYHQHYPWPSEYHLNSYVHDPDQIRSFEQQRRARQKSYDERERLRQALAMLEIEPSTARLNCLAS